MATGDSRQNAIDEQLRKIHRARQMREGARRADQMHYMDRELREADSLESEAAKALDQMLTTYAKQLEQAEADRNAEMAKESIYIDRDVLRAASQRSERTVAAICKLVRETREAMTA